MKLIQKVRSGLQIFRRKNTDPRRAYNRWASTYDEQPDNLMLTLDHELFGQLLKNVDLRDKLIVDIGCGTGRHWNTLFAAHPKALVGYDVSEEMLKILNSKYPLAKTYEVKDDNRLVSETGSVDILISTLAIAHIKEIETAFNEWSRVLKRGSELLITDYHPETLARGGDRTFSYQGKTIYIKNYVHPLNKIIALAEQNGIQLISLSEKRIDETVKHFYEKHNALNVYERFKGTPIIYGMHLKKVNDTE
ncbi:methyltransferase domain-containing protein [Flavihumibacter sp. R14]|nr:methyltransferase domain-containing protein [Flavihumibacter soli]